MELGSHSLVIFCGPNNAGKSAALREIKQAISMAEPGNIVAEVNFSFTYSATELKSLLNGSAAIIDSDGNGFRRYRGLDYSITDHDIDFYFQYSHANKKYKVFIDYFTSFAVTSSRITDSDPPKSIALLRNPPKHAIHTLQYNGDLLTQLSSYFERAFGQSLFVHQGAGGEVPLYVGPPIDLEDNEHPLSFSYLRRLEDLARPLEEQGDGMRSFASVMLKTIAQVNPTMIFIDEPEAFLHPPQAKLIGEFLASERRSNVQLFVSTHSSDVVEGILRAATEDTTLIRIERVLSGTKTSILDKAAAKEISTEPLTRYSNILDGLFHKHVIICEAETDSAFYNSILDSISNNSSSDILFSHGNGKASLAKIAKALVALHVPVSCIVDIDVLNEEKTFRAIYEALGGDWLAVKVEFLRFQKAVESWANFLRVADVKKEVGDTLKGLKDMDPLTSEARNRIRDAIKRSSPWETLKIAGRQGIPAGQMIADFDHIYTQTSGRGLWIVPVGEVESFCKMSSGGHGPAWLRNVLTEYDIAAAPELAVARDFIKKVYDAARR